MTLIPLLAISFQISATVMLKTLIYEQKIYNLYDLHSTCKSKNCNKRDIAQVTCMKNNREIRVLNTL